MNKIYDFNQIEETRGKQKTLILAYIAASIFLIAVVAAIWILIENNVVLTFVFALVLFSFILFSIVFWKIKYGILKKYCTFLDNLESGNREDYVGVFYKNTVDDNDDFYDTYVFVSGNDKVNFLIHKQHSQAFTEGKKYHIEHVGNYICQWEIIE